MARRINYDASPTCSQFHNSDKVVRGVRGPVGSGKSVGCINELHRLAVSQYPNSNGVRKTRWAIIRNTTPELRTTTLNTFKQWIPEELCPITLHPLIMGTLEYPLQDGTKVCAEFLFLALDNPKDVRKLLSLEVTGVFINEAREVSFSVVKAARERIGRYPSLIDGYEDADDYTGPRDSDGNYQPCTRKALVMDTNPPDTDHWWYQLAEDGYLDGVSDERVAASIDDTRRIFDFFSCPPPLIKDEFGEYRKNPKAENIKFLPGGYQYYLDMIAGNTDDHINVMVLGNYGSIQDGKPCYPEYSDSMHARPLKLIKGIPVALGWDFGLTPTVVFGQLTSTGQLRVLAELVGDGIGVRQFARDIVKPWMAENLKGFRIAFSVGDPAGNNRGEGEGRSAIGILNDDNEDGDLIEPLEMGFMTVPAPSNDPTIRLDAVKSFLTKMVDQGQPGYLLNSACKWLRSGKQGKYQYKRVQVSGEDRFHDKPNKNAHSHPADAEQYLALGYLNGYDVDEDEEPDDFDHYQGRSSINGY